MISPFGVDHGEEVSKREPDPERGNKVFGSGTKTALTVGGGTALLLGRKNAAALGTGVVGRAKNRAAWSAGRAAQMPAGKIRNARTKYAAGLDRVASGPGRNPDVREWTGRATAAGVTGGAAGTAVYGRRRLTPVEGKKKK